MLVYPTCRVNIKDSSPASSSQPPRIHISSPWWCSSCLRDSFQRNGRLCFASAMSQDTELVNPKKQLANLAAGISRQQFMTQMTHKEFTNGQIHHAQGFCAKALGIGTTLQLASGKWLQPSTERLCQLRQPRSHSAQNQRETIVPGNGLNHPKLKVHSGV